MAPRILLLSVAMAFALWPAASAAADSVVDPSNHQLGKQIHLPILDFQGQDDICRSWIEVQYIGCDPAQAILVTWGEPGFCPPQAAGPLKVVCTGLVQPGSTWRLLGAEIPTGSKSGILFKFTALRLSELPGSRGPTLADDFGFDALAADVVCELLFYGLVGEGDDFHRFKKAYNEGLSFEGIPLGTISGGGVLAVEVLRHCPGDATPGVEVSSSYTGIADTQLGSYDPIFGGFAYYLPLIYVDKAGLNSAIYIQNAGLKCASVEIWLKAQDDCFGARICEIFTLAPAESYGWDASDCIGPDWQGSAWLRSSEPLAIAVDIFGRDILMTYSGEPQPFAYTVFVEEGEPQVGTSVTSGDREVYGPLMYSEYQGWDSSLQVMNLSADLPAKVKLYFLDRSGDVITTLVDWICPRGSQHFVLPLVADLPGAWLGSIRIESQDRWDPGMESIGAPGIVAVATLTKHSDVARSEMQEAIAYKLLPGYKSYLWQFGRGGGGMHSGDGSGVGLVASGMHSGVGLVAIPSLSKDLDGGGGSSEIAIMNLVAQPGFTDFAIYLFDQNGLLDFVCQTLHDRQAEYIDLQTWGFVNTGFRGSAIISATFWEHEVFTPTGQFVHNQLGLGAVQIERAGSRLGEDLPGDRAAGSQGIPFSGEFPDKEYCLDSFTARCAGLPVFTP